MSVHEVQNYIENLNEASSNLPVSGAVAVRAVVGVHTASRNIWSALARANIDRPYGGRLTTVVSGWRSPDVKGDIARSGGKRGAVIVSKVRTLGGPFEAFLSSHCSGLEYLHLNFLI